MLLRRNEFLIGYFVVFTTCSGTLGCLDPLRTGKAVHRAQMATTMCRVPRRGVKAATCGARPRWSSGAPTGGSGKTCVSSIVVGEEMTCVYRSFITKGSGYAT